MGWGRKGRGMGREGRGMGRGAILLGIMIFRSDFEDVETRYIASLGGFGFLEFSRTEQYWGGVDRKAGYGAGWIGRAGYGRGMGRGG